MSVRLALLLITVGGCASAGPPEDVLSRQPAIYTSNETGTLLGEKPRPTVMTIAAPPTTVWFAIKKVHDELAIPVTVDNPTAHQIGNANFYKTRVLAGQPMTTFVDCGSGMEGPKAASYRIYMSLLTVLTSDGSGGTSVQTTFVPTGQDMSGGASDRVSCGTTGRFEELFLDRVKATIAK